jgi:membrane fusion protein, heavy metal efflux system
MEAEATNASIPGRHWEGRVQMVSSAEDPGGHAVSIRSKSGRRLRPNIPAQVRFRITHRSEAPEVPASSLVTDGERQYVYVLTAPDRLTRRAVATGSPEGDRVPILSGLRAGETIVEEGALFLENEMALHHDASEQPAGGEE